MGRAASFDPTSPLLMADRGRPLRPSVGITVDPSTPLVARADFVRIDPARLSLAEIESARRRQAVEGMLDLPGSHTRRRVNVLTRSELLLYAATEDFTWVNLRDAHCYAEVEQAHEILPESTRLSVSTSSLDRLGQWPRRLWESIDLVLLEFAEFGEIVRCLREGTLEVAILAARQHEVACHVLGGLLPSLESSRRTDIREVGVISELLSCGCAGLVMDRTPIDPEDSQLAIDVLRLISQNSRTRDLAPDSTRRPAARVDGTRPRAAVEIVAS